MSISAAVRGLLGARLLLRPSSFLDISARKVFLAPDIHANTMRPFADTIEGERYAAVAAYLDAFSELNEITASQNPRIKPPDVMLARVSPVELEFWSMRIVDPSDTAGMRVLGGFCATDEFVGLTCDFREKMDFDEDVKEFPNIWADYL